MTLLLSALALVWSAEAAQAVLLGGTVAVLPNVYFARAATRAWRPGAGGDPGALDGPVRRGAADAAGIGETATLEAGRFLGQWLVKMVLTIVLLVVALALVEVGGLGFFIGLGTVLLVPLAAPLLGADPGPTRMAR